jgi:ERF superfamily
MATAAEVILSVMSDVSSVAKKDKNTSQGFNFRGIDAVVNAVGPALRKAGGFIVPTVLEKSNEIHPSRNGGSLHTVRLTVQYAIYGTEGEPIIGVAAGEAMDSGDKATAKAHSICFRIFMLQTFALPTDEPDPDTFSYETGSIDVGALVDWAAAIADATTEAELKAIWEQVQGFGDAKVNGTTLKALVVERKKAVK